MDQNCVVYVLMETSTVLISSILTGRTAGGSAGGSAGHGISGKSARFRVDRRLFLKETPPKHTQPDRRHAVHMLL